VGHEAVTGAETVGHDVAQATVELGQAVVHATETVAHDLTEAGKQLRQGSKNEATKASDHPRPNAAPVAAS
jgi:hypothetical protein